MRILSFTPFLILIFLVTLIAGCRKKETPPNPNYQVDETYYIGKIGYYSYQRYTSPNVLYKFSIGSYALFFYEKVKNINYPYLNWIYAGQFSINSNIWKADSTRLENKTFYYDTLEQDISGNKLIQCSGSKWIAPFSISDNSPQMVYLAESLNDTLAYGQDNWLKLNDVPKFDSLEISLPFSYQKTLYKHVDSLLISAAEVSTINWGYNTLSIRIFRSHVLKMDEYRKIKVVDLLVHHKEIRVY